MGLKVTNNAISRLPSGISAGDLSLSVMPGTGALFPTLGAGDYFPATLVRASDSAVEIVKVTARATDVFTIERAQENTTALAFVSGDRIELRWTAKTFNDQAVDTATHAASSKTTPVDADELPLVDSAASNGLKKLTWANVKATLKTYFDGLYRSSSDDVTLAAGKSVIFEGATDDAFETTVTVTDPTADRTITIPDASGKLALEPVDNTSATPATEDILLFSDVSDSSKPKKATIGDILDLVAGGGQQIFPIATPTLNAGAMTVALNPCAISFQATSLTAGGVNTVDLPSGLSGTIPQGATFGIPNAVSGRIAVLVAYNGGSPVMCFANVAGGINLDETTLISPTTISASSTSATTIYSVSAVSANSRFRVVGFLNSTQTTSGTYATAPNVISGGVAQLGAMMTLGYGQTWQTPARSAGTTYYNTTGRPITVVVTCNSSTGSLTITCNGVTVGLCTAFSGQSRSSVSFQVPHGGSYSVTDTGCGIYNWAELR